jgi:hypothetical protein
MAALPAAAGGEPMTNEPFANRPVHQDKGRSPCGEFRMTDSDSSCVLLSVGIRLATSTVLYM